ncbi:MAG: tRNA uridine-5-carboxymethylaminomethyl(34) synthesis GTPase MnmE [Spirochaetes bacterium]|nr:tRNA uridine-5-carboxymethylaminomethyl(34) synthesis GTPase MnmE [Spirochaetota bacterium]
MDDTICAPATPPAQSSIAVIRVSGPGTYGALESIFSRAERLEPRRALFGSIHDRGRSVDDVIVVFYQGHSSYTGEDMAEISCHGNPLIAGAIIRLLNGQGVRLAEPGEFTRRAFLNGKIDLTGAEAINQIIAAQSEWEIEASLRQMHGSLKLKIGEIRRMITDFKADIEACIDFPDEDIDCATGEKAIVDAMGIQRAIEDLLEGCRSGEKLCRGIDITIAGRPNVGKSSILNLLLNRERAIVTGIPGTTRDVLREPFQIGGMHVNLIDTAGIDTPCDEIERIGIDLSHRYIRSSSHIILVFDACAGFLETDRKLLATTAEKKRVILVNKIDAVQKHDVERMQQSIPTETIPFSAKNGTGTGELKRALEILLREEFSPADRGFIADIRIIGLLEKGLETASRVVRLVETESPVEIIAFELQSLMESLAEITGEITPDDVLDSVFSRFCIGK